MRWNVDNTPETISFVSGPGFIVRKQNYRPQEKKKTEYCQYEDYIKQNMLK